MAGWHGGVSLLGAPWVPVWVPCLGAMYEIHYVSPVNHRCLYGGVSCSVKIPEASPQHQGTKTS